MSSTVTPTRERALTVLLPVLTAVVFLSCWQAFTKLWAVPAVILPAPSDIAHQLAGAWRELLYQASFTGAESVAACFLSAALGALVAATLAASPLLRQMLYPNLVAFQLIPKIALAPLFVIWLGIDAPSRLVFSVFISFFPVAIGTLTGLLDTNPNAIRLCQSLTASPSQIFRHVQVPYALPFFFSGMKVAATLSVIGIIVGEFISSKHGLGSYILLAGSRAETARIFAAVVVLCAIGLALYGMIVWLELRVRKAWHG
ncbi:ABC transporter permease [Rhodopila sp.]|uniref:ABC transporter permease n=1 Tax=Rhodopila sp. TaxID=2480087 RepID=UPI003D14437E